MHEIVGALNLLLRREYRRFLRWLAKGLAQELALKMGITDPDKVASLYLKLCELSGLAPDERE